MLSIREGSKNADPPGDRSERRQGTAAQLSTAKLAAPSPLKKYAHNAFVRACRFRLHLSAVDFFVNNYSTNFLSGSFRFIQIRTPRHVKWLAVRLCEFCGGGKW